MRKHLICLVTILLAITAYATAQQSEDKPFNTIVVSGLLGERFQTGSDELSFYIQLGPVAIPKGFTPRTNGRRLRFLCSISLPKGTRVSTAMDGVKIIASGTIAVRAVALGPLHQIEWERVIFISRIIYLGQPDLTQYP